MSVREQERLVVMRRVVAGERTLKEAAEELEVSYRHVRRIHRRFQEKGSRGLVHGSRGRRSNRAYAPEFREQVVELFKTQYADYGPTLASEVLREEHNVSVNAETLRRWLHEEHLLYHRTRHRLHRRRRERRGHFGELLQIDGSLHAWFEDRGPDCCLMVAVDDATGRMVGWFSDEETLDGAYHLLRKWLLRHGVPEAVYADKKNVYHGDRFYFKKNRAPGTEPEGDFLRACRQLGIRVIAAHSAQAKGRVERRNGVLQDRLVKALRRRGISTIAQANEVLDEILDGIDAKFAVAPRKPVDRHRQCPDRALLNRVLSHETQRTVQSDWTISWEAKVLQIDRQEPLPRPREHVTVRRCLDGKLEIDYRGHVLNYSKAKRQPNRSVPSTLQGGGY